jgi:transposase-like protein
MATRERRDLAKEQFWRQMLRGWRASRLSIHDFCAKHDLAQSSFYFWRRTIAERDQEAATSPSTSPKSKINNKASIDSSEANDPPLFVPVNLPTSKRLSTTNTEQPIEVVLDSGMLVRVPVGFDDGTLRQLLAILAERIEEGPSC